MWGKNQQIPLLHEAKTTLIPQIAHVLGCSAVSDSFLTPWTAARQAPIQKSYWDFPGKNTGVGCHFFLSRPPLPRGQTHFSFGPYICRQILYHWATWQCLKQPSQTEIADSGLLWTQKSKASRFLHNTSIQKG